MAKWKASTGTATHESLAYRIQWYASTIVKMSHQINSAVNTTARMFSTGTIVANAGMRLGMDVIVGSMGIVCHKHTGSSVLITAYTCGTCPAIKYRVLSFFDVLDIALHPQFSVRG